MAFKRGQLHYFVTVAEDGQMTRAARKLNLAQPALSRAISQLESELGIQLLDRHARGVTVTPAGEMFLPKARAALAAYADVSLTARSLARAAQGSLEVGFIGPPPRLNAPELFDAFLDAHPHASVSFREMPFPRRPTASWVEEVDAAFCLTPIADPGVLMLSIRAERRAAVMPADHPLAGREELRVAELLDETFISYHPDVQPQWAGFHSLDDHRGGPPGKLSAHRVSTPAEMLAAMAARRAITTVPASDAAIVEQVLRGIVAIPVCDAAPAMLSLLWRKGDSSNPLVGQLAAFARGLIGDADEPQPRNGE
ncbi:MAG: transcriptional regulator [Solirubrobacterales bacterium]|jgi:DNA-binding transcriptional LysR family regulator|nr:transcriptional regulator [Solirubrobacterales bacterium]